MPTALTGIAVAQYGPSAAGRGRIVADNQAKLFTRTACGPTAAGPEEHGAFSTHTRT